MIRDIVNKAVQSYRSEKTLWPEWTLVILVSGFAFISFVYTDFVSLTIWSTNILDSIWDGNLYGFYSYSAENIYSLDHGYAGTNIFSLIIWAIWNIPIWIAQRFFGVGIVISPISLAWSKLFLVGILCATLFLTYKICMYLTENRNKSLLAVFLTASSVYVLIGVLYSGQNCILMLFFFVLAFYAFIKDKHLLFYIFCACSIAVKPFIVPAFVAVILLTEKNIFRIIGKVASGFSILLLLELIFHNAPMYSESLNAGPTMREVSRLIVSSLTTGIEPSWLIVALVLIYFYCYTRRIKDKKKMCEMFVYVVSLTTAAMLVLTNQGFYRHIMFAPFLFILIAMSGNKLRLNVLIDIFASASFIILSLLISPRTFLSPRYFNNSIAFMLSGSPHAVQDDAVIYRKLDIEARIIYNALEAVLGENVMHILQSVASGVFTGAFVLLMVINHPDFKTKYDITPHQPERWLLWGRVLIPVPFMMLFYYFAI